MATEREIGEVVERLKDVLFQREEAHIARRNVTAFVRDRDLRTLLAAFEQQRESYREALIAIKEIATARDEARAEISRLTQALAAARATLEGLGYGPK